MMMRLPMIMVVVVVMMVLQFSGLNPEPCYRIFILIAEVLQQPVVGKVERM